MPICPLVSVMMPGAEDLEPPTSSSSALQPRALCSPATTGHGRDSPASEVGIVIDCPTEQRPEDIDSSATIVAEGFYQSLGTAANPDLGPEGCH